MTTAKSPSGPATAWPITLEPAKTSTFDPPGALPAITIEPSGSTRRMSNVGGTISAFAVSGLAGSVAAGASAGLSCEGSSGFAWVGVVTDAGCPGLPSGALWGGIAAIWAGGAEMKRSNTPLT